MRAHLIIDCGGRVLTALLIQPDGSIVPVSQEVRGVATRYVSMDVLFDPRLTEGPEFVWEDAFESLERARPRDFFRRARRVGMWRPWDGTAPAGALRLAPPLDVLSSAVALADRSCAEALPRFSLALLDALLEPAFAFAAERRLAPADVDVTLVIPSRAGRAARIGLQKLVRRRGFARASIVRRELAVALSLLDASTRECVVIDATGEDLHVHRVMLDASGMMRAAQSSTLRGFGWSHWVTRIATALGGTASRSFDRSLVALLTGSPESLPSTITHTELHAALGDRWVEAERNAWSERLRATLETVAAGNVPLLFAGEVFALDAVRRVFGGSPSSGDGIDIAVRGVAQALAGDPPRTLLLGSAGSLRLDSLRGEALELLSPDQLPAPGESCHVERTFRFAGEPSAGSAFLFHLLWGADPATEGNATLAAVPLALNQQEDGELHVTVHLRRSRSGALMSGTAEAKTGRGAAKAQFTHDLEVRR
ncbi:MAG TPA: hypothetical protein VGD79_13900 [Thermoanaerobaculia bacterium]|jgi:hypothetical protein